MVCTAMPAAQNDYLDKMETNSDYYQTYDSALLNGLPEAEVMYAYEGLMVHFGELLLYAFQCNA